jgi:leucine dehydrogenase
MQIFKRLETDDYEQLVYCYDVAVGLKAIICIHDTTLGPALGGLRIRDYQSEEEAVEDVLRLARGMTYKSAAAGLNLGGGKAVIIGDPKKIKSRELFHAFARYVNTLNGRYITAQDMNTTPEDISFIHEVTDYVVGIAEKSGDPSPITAYGVFRGILAAVNWVFGTDDLKGRVVAVQGLGAVGYRLCRLLHEAGAKLIVTNRSPEKVEQAVEEFGAQAVAPEEIYSVECDVFAPCAVGGVINETTIEQLNCIIVAGCANNQLADSSYGERLMEREILYVPDYVINAGGVINVYEELQGYNEANAVKKAAAIYDSVQRIIEIAVRDQISTSRAADRLAEERINAKKRAD